jgi:hypothetical protein
MEVQDGLIAVIVPLKYGHYWMDIR